MSKEPQELEKMYWQKLGVCLRRPLRAFDREEQDVEVLVIQSRPGGGGE